VPLPKGTTLRRFSHIYNSRNIILKTKTPTDIQNIINTHLVAQFYTFLQEHPHKYARKRYYYKKVGKTAEYVALGVARALIDSEEG
jgi:hypothetical protein